MQRVERESVARRYHDRHSDSNEGVSTETLREVLDKFGYISNNKAAINAVQRIAVMAMIAAFGADDVVGAFREFWSSLEDIYQLRFATVDFVARGPDLVKSLRQRRKDVVDRTKTNGYIGP
jgi:hypothetical protein